MQRPNTLKAQLIIGQNLGGVPKKCDFQNLREIEKLSNCVSHNDYKLSNPQCYHCYHIRTILMLYLFWSFYLVTDRDRDTAPDKPYDDHHHHKYDEHHDHNYDAIMIMIIIKL